MGEYVHSTQRIVKGVDGSPFRPKAEVTDESTFSSRGESTA